MMKSENCCCNLSSKHAREKKKKQELGNTGVRKFIILDGLFDTVTVRPITEEQRRILNLPLKDEEGIY
jgi:hypothetical protein